MAQRYAKFRKLGHFSEFDFTQGSWQERRPYPLRKVLSCSSPEAMFWLILCSYRDQGLELGGTLVPPLPGSSAGVRTGSSCGVSQISPRAPGRSSAPCPCAR